MNFMPLMGNDELEIRRLYKANDDQRTRARWSQIARIMELAEMGYQYRGISVRLKKEGIFLDRKTVKKILMINGYAVG